MRDMHRVEGITALGLIPVNDALLATIVSFVLTYLIVLLQSAGTSNSSTTDGGGDCVNSTGSYAYAYAYA